MKSTVNKIFILLLAIVLLGFVLRSHNFTIWPRLGATFDEYAWTWLGMSLIQEGTPSSWSPHSQYEGYREHVVYQDANFWIVKPYLEHPPFFGIVAGSFAIANGVESMFEVTIAKIRPLALILGILSIFSLFLFIRELYSEEIALLASLIYATVPTIVIGSRLVQNENFFIPMFLLSLLSTVKFLKTGEGKYRNLAAIICGLLLISKAPWVAAPLAISMILTYQKKYRDVVKFLAIVIPIFLLFIVYGFYYNPEIFINLWKLQLQRYDIVFNSLFALFTEPYLADRYMIDGWIYFGWISFFLLLIKDFKKHYVLILSLLAYFAVFVFAIPNEAGHGWYRYPFYPFLAISIAFFVKDYFNKNLLLTFFFFIFVGLSLLQLTWGQSFGFSFPVFRIFLLLSGLSLLPLFFENIKIKKASSLLNFLLLVFIFSLNVWTVFSYNEQ